MRSVTIQAMKSQGGRLGALALLYISLTIVPAEVAGAASARFPSSMAATGDSITRAFNTGPLPFSDATTNSWSTGINSLVNSHYQRLLSANKRIRGKNFNDAKSGARMADLNGQVSAAGVQGVAYVTILIGANDVCTSSEASMTEVATFRSQFETAMATVTGALPNARIYVVSIPNIYQLWELFKDNGAAHWTWTTYGICQSMLANPSSSDPADTDRRTRVLQRETELNAELAAVCALYAQCRFDTYAVFNTAFTTADVSTRDYFHPSIAGQAKLATVSWNAGYWGTP